MAQTTVLASGTTATTSSDIVIAAGSVKTVGVFASGAIPTATGFAVMLDTPDADVLVGVLSAASPAMVIAGPGTFRVVRPLLTVAVGVFTEG